MSEEQEKLAGWLAYLKEKNLWDRPRIAYAFLCDAFYEDSDTIILFKEFLLSDIGKKLVQQISNNAVDAMGLYLEYKDGVEDRARLVVFIDSVCQVFNVTSGLDDMPEESTTADTMIEPAPQTEPVTEPERSADEYYQLACRQKTNVGIADKELYIRYMSKAADLGHIKAMQFMALCYMRGKHVEPDEVKAVELYRKCAELKDGQSCYELYRYYKSRKPDKNMMLEYLQMAADYGVPSAKYDLAMEYANEGTDEGYRKAFSLYSEAGEQGDPCAYYQLALFYRYGRGVGKDMGQARKMLEKAAELGHSEAREILRGGSV